MRRRAGRCRGTSLVEVLTGTVIGVMIIGSAATVADAMQRNSTGVTRRTTLSLQSASACQRLFRDLSIAGVRAEDTNGNGLLDRGEDTNMNGRLDADWSLPDGQSAGQITFNTVVKGWDWSGPITYRVADGVLRRETGGQILELARGVVAFTVARAGDNVAVRLTLAGTDGRGEEWTQTTERTTYVRN